MGQDRKHGPAIKAYDQVLLSDPTNVKALLNRGLAHAELDDYDRAIQDYDQAIHLNARSASAFRNRSLAYAHENKFLPAISDAGRYLWLKFGLLGITLRLFLLALTVAFGLGWKRFRREDSSLDTDHRLVS